MIGRCTACGRQVCDCAVQDERLVREAELMAHATQELARCARAAGVRSIGGLIGRGCGAGEGGAAITVRLHPGTASGGPLRIVTVAGEILERTWAERDGVRYEWARVVGRRGWGVT